MIVRFTMLAPIVVIMLVMPGAFAQAPEERKPTPEEIEALTEQAKKGDAEAQYGLAGLYADGWGVDQNYEVAVQWWSKAAGQNHARAQYNLGLAYMEGLGIERDYQ